VAVKVERPRVRGHYALVIAHVLRVTPLVSHGGTQRLLIALTFDDGPSRYTSAIISTLVRMHVPATFFIVGRQLRLYPGGLRAEVRDGFEIGDHTQDHGWLVRLGLAAQFAEVGRAALGIERLGGPFPLLFRPPYGAYNVVTLTILRRLGMLTVLWSVDPQDWRRPGVRAIVRAVLAEARPGAIVLLHDGGGNRAQTVAALPAIIRALRRRHYEFVMVAQLLAADPPRRAEPVRSFREG
jgi:peptidoglycan/xylan/chitin deacetylase (PgdA/CDA1 family)